MTLYTHVSLKPNGANLTGGGTGGDAASQSSTSPYVPFNGDLPRLPASFGTAMVVAVIGAIVGSLGVFSKV